MAVVGSDCERIGGGAMFCVCLYVRRAFERSSLRRHPSLSFTYWLSCSPNEHTNVARLLPYLAFVINACHSLHTYLLNCIST